MTASRGLRALPISDEPTDEQEDDLYHFNSDWVVGTRPSKKSLQRIVGAIRKTIDRRVLWLEADDLVKTHDRKLVGWANYFCLGPVSKAYHAIDTDTARRLR